jgi:hypothetical protein
VVVSAHTYITANLVPNRPCVKKRSGVALIYPGPILLAGLVDKKVGEVLFGPATIPPQVIDGGISGGGTKRISPDGEGAAVIRETDDGDGN